MVWGVMRPRAAKLVCLSLVVLACRGAEAPPAATDGGGQTGAATAAAAAPRAEVAWFEGTVEQAMATAKAERKPLFLYWGAVWCPPCHYLKGKLFARPEFVARMRGFVPVYLDGDTAQAQTWGEKLQTTGYPTVIVLDPDGRELTRIATMLPVDEYAEVLDAAVTMTRPIDALIAEVRERGPAAMAPADLNLLAFYSWGQAPESVPAGAERGQLLRRLADETPEAMAVERNRFLALYLGEVAGAEPATELTAEERSVLSTRLLDLLADPVLRNTNLDLIFYAADDVVALLAPEPGAERQVLAGAWVGAAQAMEEDAALSVDDRVTALVPQIALARLTAPAVDVEPAAAGEGEASLPAEVLARVRTRVAWGAGAVHDEHELQAVMSSMVGALLDAGLNGEAEALIDQRLDDTVAPYYYVATKAGLRERAGDTAAAVALYRQAWEAARQHSAAASQQGGATAQGADAGMTRFRWGSRYLLKAMKLSPTAVESIAADGAVVLDELLASSDPFAGGNWSRLEQVTEGLAEWNADGSRQAAFEALRGRIEAACAGLADAGADSPGGRCRSLLAAG